MKNCLEFCVIKLTQFIMTLGIFEVSDILNQFAILTDVITLEKSYHRTINLSKMMYGAKQSEHGYLNLKARSDLVKHLVQLLTNPGSQEEATQMNSALKALNQKLKGNTTRFYNMLSEGVHRRMLFQKLSQIYAPLIEEVKTNKEMLIMMLNNKLNEMNHLQELSGHDETPVRIAHYIIHSVNSYQKLNTFTYICQTWCRDTNMIEQLLDITFEIQMFQCSKLQDKITEDSKKIICEIY